MLKVVGAGVGRTGTHSLKLALERLLGGRCHHMVEIIGDPAQASGWTEAVDGQEVDWQQLLSGYVAVVDWPGASFWRQLSTANPEALVLLSTRDADAWYRSASNTIFQPVDRRPPGLEQWFGTTVPKMFAERFGADLGNPTAMMEAFERHNAQVRAGVPRAACWSGLSPTAGSRSASGWVWPSRTRRSRSPTARTKRARSSAWRRSAMQRSQPPAERPCPRFVADPPVGRAGRLGRPRPG